MFIKMYKWSKWWVGNVIYTSFDVVRNIFWIR